MSEIVNMKNLIQSQKNIHRNSSKLFPENKKNSFSGNNSEILNSITKSRNIIPIKPGKLLGLSFYQNNPNKSNFFSKFDSSTSTNYNYNSNINDTIRYIRTERNYMHVKDLKSVSNKNETISLSSLYKLPDYKRKTNNFFTKNSFSINKSNNSSKINDIQNISNIFFTKLNDDKNNNNTILLSNWNLDSDRSNNKLNNTINNSSLNINSKRSKSQKENDSNLEYFMKEKFYSDIKERLNKEYQFKIFMHDYSVKDKLIELNQVREFWGGVFDYVNPILITKKFHYMTKLIDDRKKLRDIKTKFGKINEDETRKYYNYSEKKNKVLKMPKLYTNIKIIEKRKKEIKEERLIDNMMKNQTEETMKKILNKIYE